MKPSTFVSSHFRVFVIALYLDSFSVYCLLYSAVSFRFSTLILLPLLGILFKCRVQISYLRFVGAWRSLVAHLLWEQGVGGSNPLAPTSLRLEQSAERRRA
jgi:hypothetical protein